MGHYTFRQWPNGEFGMGLKRKLTEPKRVKEGFPEKVLLYSATKSETLGFMAALSALGHPWEGIRWRLAPHEMRCLQAEGALGSSNVANFHRPQKRGTKGITAYGRKMVRNGAFLLHRATGRYKMGMFTGTLPPAAPDIEKAAIAAWPQIVRVFAQWLSRKVQAAGKKGWLVGVTEIQMERFEQRGGLPLHIHVLFESKVERRYILSPSEFSEAWKRAVCSAVPEYCDSYWGASSRVETVRKSAEKYMAKYLSKGSPQMAEIAREQGYQWPSSWWFCYGGLRQAIKKETRYDSGEIAAFAWGVLKKGSSLCLYVYESCIGEGEFQSVVGVAGRLSTRGVADFRTLWASKNSAVP